ncbi:hypothetical protein ACCC92_23930 [Mucilaginibacter sp. Mucisp84]|uniref:hypothetical protein n=1 Tax=Mucilaginibacter sp. Mucisp84 TaxID=3243058 RepID=UPI0039A74171
MKTSGKLMLPLLCCSALIVGCKRKDKNINVDKTIKRNGISTTLTKEEHLKLTAFLMSSAVIDSAGFTNKINEIKSESSQQNKSSIANNSSSIDTNGTGYEEQNFGSFTTLFTYNINQGDADYRNVAGASATATTLRKGFRAVNESYLTFAVRENRIKTVIPFVAVIDKNALNDRGHLVKIAEQVGALPHLVPDGPHWGTFSSVGPTWLQSVHTQGNTTMVNVVAMGSEIRKRVVSSTGEVKILSDADATRYKAGTALDNVYNNYTLSGIIRVTYNGAGFMRSSDDTPRFTCFSTLKCKQDGILRT